MLFKDRVDAAQKLLPLLQKDPSVKKGPAIILSLLRGGVILGNILAKRLKTKHLPLVVTKISSPYNTELAIGALCFDVTYLEQRVIDHLKLSKHEISQQIKQAEQKFVSYCQRFDLNETLYGELRDKVVVIVDDGVATGASVRCAALFLKTKQPKKLVLAVPIASTELSLPGVQMIAFHKSSDFSAVSQFYQSFPQVEDNEVMKVL